MVRPETKFVDIKVDNELLFGSRRSKIEPKRTIRIAYLEKVIGDPFIAESVIFCHGFTSSSKPLFDKFIQEVAIWSDGLGMNLRLVALDWPGHGESSRVKKYSFPLLVSSLNSFIEKLGIQKAHFFGMSLGAVVITMYAVKYPDKVASLSLQGTPIIAEDFGEEFLNKSKRILVALHPVAKVLPKDLSILPVSFLKKVSGILIKKYPKGWTLEDLSIVVNEAGSLLDNGIEAMKQLAPKAFCDLSEEFLNLDLTGNLNQLRDFSPELPLLLIDGTVYMHSFLNTIDRLEQHFRGCNVRTCKIAGAGHLATLLKPEIVAGEFLNFLLAIKKPYRKLTDLCD